VGGVTIHQDNENMATMEISVNIPDKAVAMNLYSKRQPLTLGIIETLGGRAMKWMIKNVSVPLNPRNRRIKTMLDNKGELRIRHFRNSYLLVSTPVEKGIANVDIRKVRHGWLDRGKYSARIVGKPFAEIELTYM